MDNYELKRRIVAAISAKPLDFATYEDFFSLCREVGEADPLAHEWNHELRDLVANGLQLSVSKGDFDTAERLDGLLFRCLVFSAPYYFDDYLQAVEYGKPLDKKFYQPRRHYLKRYVDAYQEILDGKLDFLSISMPKRCGKSQLGINFTNMLSGKDVITPPKTPKSNRTIPIPDGLCDCLQEYMSHCYDLQPDDRLFPYTKNFLYHEMEHGCKVSGVKRIRVHDIRHSHASLLVEMGCSPLLIAERLGHEKVQATMDTYSHLYPNKQVEVARQLDGIMP
ncbi:MAG: site-specific integrase [Clostridiales bacterium]|nr:site-specific integrase [Clostridiales bacterium]